MANLLLVQAAAHENGKLLQPISAGVIRTDYMVDKTSAQLKLVELNTFAVGGLQYSHRAAQLHRYLWRDLCTSGMADNTKFSISEHTAIKGAADTFA